MKIGTRVRVERDEQLHPARGTWRWFRGRTGTVVTGGRTGEYGVAFGRSTATDRPADAYFGAHELTAIR